MSISAMPRLAVRCRGQRFASCFPRRQNALPTLYIVVNPPCLTPLIVMVWQLVAVRAFNFKNDAAPCFASPRHRALQCRKPAHGLVDLAALPVHFGFLRCRGVIKCFLVHVRTRKCWARSLRRISKVFKPCRVSTKYSGQHLML